MTTLHSRHDKLFRSAMDIPAVAKEFLETHLPMARYLLTGIAKDDKMEFVELMNQSLIERYGEGIMISAAQELYDNGMKEGVALGRQEGMEKGMERGMEKGMEKAAINMLERGVGFAEVADITGLSIKRVMALCQTIKR